MEMVLPLIRVRRRKPPRPEFWIALIMFVVTLLGTMLDLLVASGIGGAPAWLQALAIVNAVPYGFVLYIWWAVLLAEIRRWHDDD